MWNERFNKEFKEESKKETNEKSKNELKKELFGDEFYEETTPANMSVILPRCNDICRDFWFERVFHEALEPSDVLSASGMSSSGRS